MSKSSNQKAKLLYLMKILQQKTDEEHLLTIRQLIGELAKYGVHAERKSIYSDIDTLRLCGLDIEHTKSKTTGYYIANREFQLPELKMLVDMIQSSKFITQKKSMELIGKLGNLASKYQAQALQRQVYVANRIKSMNESIYYNVDHIYSAIAKNRKICFRYYEYALTKEYQCRRNGEDYCISPLALAWNNENYYMLGFDSDAQIIKHYRVDKMKKIEITKYAREGLKEFSRIDMALYAKQTFSMYGGTEKNVRMQFSLELVNVVVDRFGKDIMIQKTEEDSCVTTVRVFVSPQFFGWVCGLGKDAKILAPRDVVEAFRDHINAIWQNIL